MTIAISETEARQVVPVPDGVAPPNFSHRPGYIGHYAYTDADGRLMAIIAGFAKKETKASGKPGKVFMPNTYFCTPDGQGSWKANGLECAYPLYRLPDLVRRPDALVIVSEGEKCADAVARALPRVASVTWAGGAKGHSKTDFRPLAGRDLLLCPDLDDPGEQAMQTLVSILTGLPVPPRRIRCLDIAGLAGQLGRELEPGLDIADLLHAGMSGRDLKAYLKARPDLLQSVWPMADPHEMVDPPGAVQDVEMVEPPREDPVPAPVAIDRAPEHRLALPPGFLMRDGCLYRVHEQRGEITEHFVCSELHVLGRAQTKGSGWGHLLKFRDPAGVWQTCVVPGWMLAGDAREMRELLCSGGVICAPDRKGREALSEYILQSNLQNDPNRMFEIAPSPGWYGDRFVLPTGIFPEEARARLILDMPETPHRYAQAGSFKDWKALAGVVAPCDCSRFILALAFVGPLLKPLKEESGGFHFFQRSSRGKSTLSKLAGSVWGGSIGRLGFTQTWNASKNGIEGLLAAHSDTLLALDEIQEAVVEDLVSIGYMIGNGEGKGRAAPSGRAKPKASWSIMVLSNGEMPIGARVETAQKRGQDMATAGLTVRMIDVPFFADLAKFACWPGEAVPMTGQVCADRISEMASRHYGFAGPAFMGGLLEDLEGNLAQARAICLRFVDEVVEADDDPQIRRIAKRFGLVAAAGALAARFEILPWVEEAAIAAARRCFAEWKAARGSTASEEERSALQQLRAFFEKHGNARFELLHRRDTAGDDEDAIPDRDPSATVRERCGYRTYHGEANVPVYYVLPEAWRSEVCRDRDPAFVAQVALKHGALLRPKPPHLQQKVRLPDFPDGKRVYVIRPDLLP